MTPTAVLHIGTHKTGTTSFQTMIAQNLAHFIAQGIYYPAAGRARASQANLAWELSGDPRYRPQAGSLEDLAGELRSLKPGAVVISSEDFERLFDKPHQLTKLRSVFDTLGYSCVVVVTLREPCDYLESLYYALSRRALTQSFDSFVADAIEHRAVRFGTRDFPLDYEQLVEGFATIFGQDALRVLAYDSSDSMTPLFDVCSEVVGLPISPLPGWQRHNVADRHEEPAGALDLRSVAADTRHRIGRLLSGTSPNSRSAAGKRAHPRRISMNTSQRQAVNAALGGQVADLVAKYGSGRGQG
jgi:hypothetical protein